MDISIAECFTNFDHRRVISVFVVLFDSDSDVDDVEDDDDVFESEPSGATTLADPCNASGSGTDDQTTLTVMSKRRTQSLSALSQDGKSPKKVRHLLQLYQQYVYVSIHNGI